MKTLLSVAIVSAMSGSAFAAGTAAGTDIDNTASISYSVGGTAQTEIESSEGGNSTPGVGNGTATTFKVDKKIDLLVTAGSGTNVVPNTSGAPTALAFTLKNEGNSTESFNLTPTQVASGGIDTFNTSGCTVTSPALPVSLAADASTPVTVQCTIPASGGAVVDGAQSYVDLMAAESTGLTETVGADTAATVDVVFADDTGTGTDGADRNAKHSATNIYTIDTADISVMKTSAVLSDPLNAGTNPKRIPGAEIEYTITVSNAGTGATASAVTITDAVPANLTYVSCSFSGDGIGNCTHGGGSVSSDSFALAAGESAVLKFKATVD